MGKKRKNGRILHYLNIASCIGALAASSAFLRRLGSGGELSLATGFFFVFMAFDRVFRELDEGKRKKLNRWIQLVIAALFVLCAVLSFMGLTGVTQTICGISCVLSVLLDSVAVMVTRHKYVTVILLDVLFLLFVIVLTSVSMYLMLLILSIKALCRVIKLSFSHVRFDIISRIIRKTYASEVLLGLFFLIVAFALILPDVDDAISTFADGLWYCFAIVTTIGFGDITATSTVGRIFSVILGIYGIIVVSLITSIIVNFYGEVRNEDEERRRRRFSKTEQIEHTEQTEQAEQPDDTEK